MLRAGHLDDRSSSINGRGRPLTISLSGLTALLIWGSLLWMMTGPPLQLPLLPSEIRVYDLLAGLAILLGTTMMARGALSSAPLRSPVFVAFFAYVAAVLFFPLVGLMFVPQAQLWMYFGDLRWLLILAMVVIAASIYSKQREGKLERDLVWVWLIAVIVTWAVLLPQIVLQVGGGSTPWVVDLWYPEGRPGRSHGFHIFRFAGPFGTISGLATFGVIGFITGMLTSIRSRWSLFVTLSGLFFILASGSRTAMVIVGVFVLLYVVMTPTKIRLSTTTLFRIVGSFAGLAGAYWAATSFGVGRLRIGSDHGRLTSILSWVSGSRSLEEISGRGAGIWLAPIEASREWSPLGTLVNSSHAVQAIDSYYVLMWAQAGPFIAIPFMFSIFTALIFASRNYLKNKNFVNSFSIAVVVILPIYSLTQNMMTGLLGRSLLGIAVLGILVFSMQNYRRSPVG